MPSPDEQMPVVHVMTLGRSANQMIQFMVAKAIADAVPGCRISNVGLVEWNIHYGPIGLPGDGRARRVDGQVVPIADLAACLCSGALTRIDLAAYGQRLEHFEQPDTYRALFKSPDLPIAGGDEDTLVISIRGGDILDGHHQDYVLLPVDFYRHVIDTTGLRPMFFGQIDDNPYVERLRAAFPMAEFRAGTGSLEDFEFIRRSRHIVLSVSTFSWLAAWLSHAAMIIFPVCGLLSPFQDQEIDLLPLDDARYRFFLFPITYAVPVEHIDKAHDPLAGLWREVAVPALRSMRDAAPRFPDPLDLHLPAFDETYYLARYPDIKASVDAGHFVDGFDHFQRLGLREARIGFDFDRKWYSQAYPLAAFEVGQGDYGSLYAHYFAIGRMRGYLPADPAPTESQDLSESGALALQGSYAMDADLGLNGLMTPYSTEFAPDMLVHEILSPGFTPTPPIERFGELLAPDLRGALSRSWSTAHPARAIRFHVLRKVFVVGEGLVFDQSLNLFKESIHQTSPEQIVGAFTRLKRETEIKQFKMHGGTSLLCGKIGINNYGHWLVEMLPLVYLSREWIGRDRWTVVVPQVYTWMKGVIIDSLRLAGVPQEQCLLNNGEAAFFEELVVITGLTEHGHYYSPLVIDCMDELASTIEAGAADKVWISRAGERRSIRNEHGLIGSFASEGWTTIEPGKISFEEQIRMAKGASHMAGVNGAGLANLLFMRPGGTLTTFVPALMPDVFFWQLAGHRGLTYREVRCAQQPDMHGPTKWDTELALDSEPILRELSRA